MIEIPATSVPINIYASKDTGTITLIYKQDVFYNTVTFFREIYTDYKYSYMEVSTQDVARRKQRQLTHKVLGKLRNHLLEVSTEPEDAYDEYTQMHTFINANIEMRKIQGGEADPIIASSYFKDLSNNRREPDVVKVYVNSDGKFMDIEYIDGSWSHKLRYHDKTFSLEDTLNKIREEQQWNAENLNKPKTK